MGLLFVLNNSIDEEETGNMNITRRSLRAITGATLLLSVIGGQIIASTAVLAHGARHMTGQDYGGYEGSTADAPAPFSFGHDFRHDPTPTNSEKIGTN